MDGGGHDIESTALTKRPRQILRQFIIDVWESVERCRVWSLPLLGGRLRSLKKSGVKAVKIIHGFGSTGKGGRLRKAILSLLDDSKKSGLIKEFVIGEQWSKFQLRTLTLIDRIPQLYKGQDLKRYNRGITIVFL
jgi:hypothetical protein